MYYPFLRARQFELITLRELASEGATQGCIVPILEPVKLIFNNLNLAYKVFEEHKQNIYLIVNPASGELIGDNNHYLDYLNGLDNEIVLPAFHYRNNSEYITQSINHYGLNQCMLICKNDIRENDEDFKVLARLEQVTVINIEDPSRNRALHRFVQGLGKTYVRLDDLFEKQARNSDFLSIEEHRFSEEHIYYAEDHYNGFSDYTVLPSEFIDGGSTPRAVVIHLTYINGQSQIMIRHFTSESNDSIANIQGKFAEAAQKAVEYCRLNHLTNSAIQELENYFDEQHYPGLGTVKKISIKNHLLIVSHYLRNR
ncbi:hypothetical protein CLU83_3630 [Flavobacterium sp. 1]|uniref:sce7725 family protein n=1 Tax=Flavobacterium sp. 1 TaxID=2035200 RepID=UPI000C245392|nr:sce7725 family protein [Flavobacterium sp. 1]PJJ10231.1 hypothetical protein CLU83_3630 [Flavobacterium sp. 1]